MSVHQFKPAQAHGAVLIASGLDQKDVAKKLGVNPSTVSVWMQSLPFRDLVEIEKQAVLDATRNRLQKLQGVAVDTLEDLLKNSTSPAVRIKAAELVLKDIGSANSKSDLGHPWPKTKTEQIIEQANAQEFQDLSAQMAGLDPSSLHQA